MRRIDVVTVGRSDWGIYVPVLRRLSTSSGVRVRILASGSHMLGDPDATLREVEAAGLGEVRRIEMLLASNSREAIAKSMGLGVAAFGQQWSAERPDLVVVLGDRFEMFAAASAAVPLLLPIAHLHGGERTGGAIDDVFRHALTKMSHLHFPSTEVYARRLRQLGEEPWRITVSGAPALDSFVDTPPLSPTELERLFNIDVERDFVLCTYHPTTLDPAGDVGLLEGLLAALERSGLPVVVTLPNVDAGAAPLRARALQACASNSARGWRAFDSLGPRGFASVLARATAVVGNSSSALIEAPHFAVPAVNVGIRQEGRVRAANVIDVLRADGIEAALARALSPAFRASLRGEVNPYGDGRASARIVDILERISLDARLLRKAFVDLHVEA